MIAAVYADGGVIGRNPSPVGGTFAWCHVSEAGERVASGAQVLLAGKGGCPNPITNNLTEFVSLVACLEALPECWSGAVFSDSRITLGRLFQGWKMDGIPWSFAAWGSLVLARLGDVHWTLLDGHPTRSQLTAGIGKRGGPVSIHNVWCDARCRELAAGEKR